MNPHWIRTLDRWNRFHSDMSWNARRSRPKHSRVPVMHDPNGKRWSFCHRHQRYFQVDAAAPEPNMYRRSVTMCRNRNERRKSFGYADTYSIRERGWPYSMRNGKPS